MNLLEADRQAELGEIAQYYSVREYQGRYFLGFSPPDGGVSMLNRDMLRDTEDEAWENMRPDLRPVHPHFNPPIYQET